MFARLVKFHREFDHTRVPEGWPDDPQLSQWVQSVRARAKAGTLLPSQRADLARVEFEVSPRETEWKAQLEQLGRFKQRYGHTSVARWSKEFPGLGVFVTNLRVRVKPNSARQLSRAQRDELNELGFDWKPLPRTERKVVELELSRRKGERAPSSSQLSSWLKVVLRGNTPLDADQARRLEQLGVEVPTPEKRRRQREEASRRQKAEWVAAGKPWPRPLARPREEVFDERFAELVAFEREFDHTRVPTDHPLFKWSHSLRSRHRKGELAPRQVAQLEALGFEFELREAEWNENFALLERYRRRFGHCDVPRFWKEDPRFATWVSSVRAARKEGTLSTEKVHALERLGFTWDRHQARWAAAMRELDAFIAEHGHARVPTKTGRLGEYLVEIRRAGRRGRLSSQQLADLSSRGVTLEQKHSPSSKNALWEERFARLSAFQLRHGHCDVPRTFADAAGLRLGSWVSHQREARAAGTLSAEHEAQLEQLGFRWSGHPGAPAHSAEIAQAVEHHRATGHWVLPAGKLKVWLETLGPGADPRVVSRLGALGAPLSSEEWAWERMFAIARERWNRTRRVEASPSSALGRWLAVQVSQALSGELEGDREARLAELDALNA